MTIAEWRCSFCPSQTMWKGKLEREKFRSLSGSLKLQTLSITLMRLWPMTPESKFSDFMKLFFTEEMMEQKEGVIQKLTMENSKLLQKFIF